MQQDYPEVYVLRLQIRKGWDPMVLVQPEVIAAGSAGFVLNILGSLEAADIVQCTPKLEQIFGWFVVGSSPIVLTIAPGYFGGSLLSFKTVHRMTES